MTDAAGCKGKRVVVYIAKHSHARRTRMHTRMHAQFNSRENLYSNYFRFLLTKKVTSFTEQLGNANAMLYLLFHVCFSRHHCTAIFYI